MRVELERIDWLCIAWIKYRRQDSYVFVLLACRALTGVWDRKSFLLSVSGDLMPQMNSIDNGTGLGIEVFANDTIFNQSFSIPELILILPCYCSRKVKWLQFQTLFTLHPFNHSRISFHLQLTFSIISSDIGACYRTPQTSYRQSHRRSAK